ncbi:hypothetical protein EXIGLDRAFT_98701 [Exidia glandulosa HHB12029]|uniref:Uncharacterized protein n=1 Tax=Exidia glandulosa HHB12029 TaxID=1314781 RepID=A0A165H122_EXIGL|nr:hypothetical protein EXIGLDRAFT_98701 [Exidia glandulosa HHB12029]
MDTGYGILCPGNAGARLVRLATLTSRRVACPCVSSLLLNDSDCGVLSDLRAFLDGPVRVSDSSRSAYIVRPACEDAFVADDEGDYLPRALLRSRYTCRRPYTSYSDLFSFKPNLSTSSLYFFSCPVDQHAPSHSPSLCYMDVSQTTNRSQRHDVGFLV